MTMQGKPGLSWGPDKPVNLVEFNGKWYAIYYHPDGFSETIECFGSVQPIVTRDILKLLTCWNYHTDRVCSTVKMLMDLTT